MKQVLGVRDENLRMKVTPPLAQEDDLQWNPNEDGALFSILKGASHNDKRAAATSHKNESSKFFYPRAQNTQLSRKL